MAKRILLFVVTNLAIMVTLSIVLAAGGHRLRPARRRLDYTAADGVLPRLGHGRRVHLAADVALDRQDGDGRAAGRRPDRPGRAGLAHIRPSSS